MNRIKDKGAVVITQDETPVPHEVLAQSIVDISRGVTKLINGPLNEKALVLLIQNSSKVSAANVRAVLHSLRTLEETYVKPKP